MPLIEARGIVKRYGERIALAGIDMEAEAGELVACIGPNGAGKTTLLNILAGSVDADGGEVLRSAQGIGWVPQQPAVYTKLSVAENLRLFAQLDGAADVETAVSEMLARSGLSDRADEQVGRLSGGNRQRVNIAIGLLAAPELLLLDEPTSALDPRQRERLWEFIGARAAEGTAVVYATHDASEAERYAHRVLVLADGERLFWGEPDALESAVAVAPGERAADFEGSFVRFLHERGH
jgi:ABC-2 type transport system ATP-binding protein